MSLEVLCCSGPPDPPGFWLYIEFLNQHLELLEGSVVVDSRRGLGPGLQVGEAWVWRSIFSLESTLPVMMSEPNQK